MTGPRPPLLSGRGLRKTWTAHDGTVVAIEDVDIDVADGERVAVVGESGAGKSTLLRLLVRLQDVDAGRIEFDGDDMTAKRGSALLAFRRAVQIVFADPSASLHPLWSVGTVVEEGLRIHGLHPDGRGARVAAVLDSVGLDADLLKHRTRSLSGGQRQRVALARALVMEPRLLLLDEPTAALDAGAVARCVKLLLELSTNNGTGLLFVTHDLHVVRHLATRMLVLFRGRVVEEGPVEAVWSSARHPYTQALLAAQPRAAVREPPPVGRGGRALGGSGPDRAPIDGASATVPAAGVAGCAYRKRCREAAAVCSRDVPPLVALGPGRRVRCWARTDDSSAPER
jgi:oligopeptide/dipeptide ABC transporter ATP-binding protein